MKWVYLIIAAECLHAITVDSNADPTGPMGTITLRDAILMGGPTIDFALPMGSETITLQSPLPNINDLGVSIVSIDGFNGGNPVIVDGNHLYPGLQIYDVDFTVIPPTPSFLLQNITFTNCLAQGNLFGSLSIGGSLLVLPSPPMSGYTFVLNNVNLLSSTAQGVNPGDIAFGGVSYTGFPYRIEGTCTFNSTPQNGTPPDNIFGYTLYSPNTNELTQFVPALTDTIAFTDSFLIEGDLEQDGPGTVSLSTSATTTPTTDLPPSVYYVFKNTTIKQGTLDLDGQVFQTPEGVLLPLPAFGAIGGLTFQSGTTLSGSGLIFAGDGQTAHFQGSTIAPKPGILLLLGNVDLQAGTNILTSVQSTQAASVMLANFTIPSPPVNIQGATLYVDVVPGDYSVPTVYALILSQELFDGLFQDIIVTGSFAATSLLGAPLDPPTVIYSPLSAPNSVLLPVNVPFGISTANIVIGTITLQGTVLYDPCAGIIVVSLLAPGQGAAALSQFFANQTVLTAQTLGSLTASLNANCLRKAEGRAASPTSPVAAWYQQKNLLLAQGSEEAKPFIPEPEKEIKEEEEKPKFLPSAFPQKKQTPNYSISLTPFGQLQDQNQITTSNAILPAYGTQSWGAILGFDYIGLETILVGGAASFAWTDLTVSKGGGGQETWSVFGTAYSSFTFGHFFFNLLATGSYNHNSATRIFSPIQGETITIESVTPLGVRSVYTFESTGVPGGTSFSKYNVYQLVPHIDFNYEIGLGSISLVPFLLSDCSLSFADSIVETGDSVLNPLACANKISLNTATDSLMTTIIQSEAGVNYFKQFDKKIKGQLIFRFKGSYVNRYTVPYTLRSKLVDSIDYTKTSIHLPMQHMFGYAAEGIYRLNRFSTVLTYQGMVGSGYLSNAFYARFALDF